MHKIITTKFVNGYWHDIIKTDKGFWVFNTQRKQNQIDRDGLGYGIKFFDTLEKAEEFLNEL